MKNLIWPHIIPLNRPSSAEPSGKFERGFYFTPGGPKSGQMALAALGPPPWAATRVDEPDVKRA